MTSNETTILTMRGVYNNLDKQKIKIIYDRDNKKINFDWSEYINIANQISYNYWHNELTKGRAINLYKNIERRNFNYIPNGLFNSSE